MLTPLVATQAYIQSGPIKEIDSSIVRSKSEIRDSSGRETEALLGDV